MKQMTSQMPDVERSPRELSRPGSRLLAMAVVVGAVLVVMVSVFLVIASEIGLEHVACKMEEDTLGSALGHARGIVRQIQVSLDHPGHSSSRVVQDNAAAFREQLRALAKDDPTMLYGMLMSGDGGILVHTDKRFDGTKASRDGEASPPLGLACEFPEGRFGHKDFVYEIRVPLEGPEWAGMTLALGLSKNRIGRHIAQVQHGVRQRMLAFAGIGAAVLAVPAAGLWYVLRRYKALAKRSQRLIYLAQMGETARGLAHEIRNPLNAVRFNLKIVEEEADRFPQDIREGYRQIIQRAAGEVRRVDELLTEYLSFVRPAHGQPEPHDLNAVVESVLKFLDGECQRYNITIQRHLTPAIPKALVDERQIRQAIMNIVLNAQQVLRPRGGEIRACTYQRDGAVILEISDNGPGLPADECERIFEPFYTKREGGTGLGLAISRRLVEDHGGTVTCRSTPGQGAAFTMTFPRAKAGGRKGSGTK